MPHAAGDLSLHATRTFEPPYDDESGGVVSDGAATDGSLALAMTLSPGRVPEAPTLRLLPGGQTEADEAGESPLTVRRTPRRELPPARIFSARLVQALSEATSGERPLSQLSPYLARPIYQRLERHFATTIRGTGTVGQDNRADVRSVRVCEPCDGVAEVAAVVRRGSRMAAIALRLEGLDGRWQCTALQIG